MKKLFIGDRLAIKGQEVTTFRGDKLILSGWREPHKPSSSGRVYVKDNSGEHEYFPGVVGGEFRDDPCEGCDRADHTNYDKCGACPHAG